MQLDKSLINFVKYYYLNTIYQTLSKNEANYLMQADLILRIYYLCEKKEYIYIFITITIF